jgi:hypothetical protein
MEMPNTEIKILVPDIGHAWQSRNGMVTRQFRRQINMMRRYEDSPKRLVIHVGANDIGGSCPSNC